MRRVAIVPNPKTEILRVILHETENGTYLYLSKSMHDDGSSFDEWHLTTQEACEVCESVYGITAAAWEAVPEPLLGCQHDWIAPVRVWRSNPPRLQRLVDGRWIPIRRDEERG